MKLFNLSIIVGAVILTVIIYVLTTNNAELEMVRNAKDSYQNIDYRILPETVSNSDKRNNEDLGRALLSLRGEVDMLRKEILMLKADKQFATLSTQKTAVDEEKQKMTKEELIAQQEQISRMEKERVKQQNEEFETEFRQQTINPGWSAKTEQLIKDALIDSSFSESDIVSLKCHSSKCRVELSTEDAQQEQSNLMVFPGKVVADLPNINLNKTNGRTTIIYLSRNDAPPPIQKIGQLTELQ